MVGALLGAKVGEIVGFSEGLTVGFTVGRFVGDLDEGAFVVGVWVVGPKVELPIVAVLLLEGADVEMREDSVVGEFELVVVVGVKV